MLSIANIKPLGLLRPLFMSCLKGTFPLSIYLSGLPMLSALCWPLQLV